MRPTIALLQHAATTLTLALLVACTPGDARDARDADTVAASPRIAPLDAPEPAADTTTVVVAGPTLVAFVPAGLEARMDADSTGEVSTVTDDFFHYFAEATGQLSDMGVQWRVREADTLAFAGGERRWTWAPPGDSSYVGYYVASPGKPPLVLYGVHVDDELVELVARHLGVPVPPKEQRR